MEYIIISLGGSVIVPEDIDVIFLRKLRKLFLSLAKQKKKFVIVCGGGSICRQYQQRAQLIKKVTPDDLDWLGIHVSRLNAHLLRTILSELAFPNVLKKPQKQPSSQPITLAGGFKPGRSSDYQAVMFALAYNSTKIINVSNIDGVYEQDPKKYPFAKKLSSITWPDFRKLVGDTWSPGMNAPFDPIASQVAQQNKLKVFVVSADVANLKKAILDDSFIGTVIG